MVPDAAFIARITEEAAPSQAPLTEVDARVDFSERTETRSVTAECGSEVQTGADPTGRWSVLLWGETYPASGPSEVAQRIRDGGARSIRDLDGSYSVLAVDRVADRVVVVTDRMGSRPVYVAERNGRYTVSSSVAALPTADHALDEIGVAWYLTHGCMQRGRTPYEGVGVLEAASVHELTDKGIRSERYWGPADPTDPADLREVEEELVRLIVDAVARRTDLIRPVYLSLSSGWDSATIAAVLADELGRSDVRFFSYAHGDPREGTDAWGATRIARDLGVGHDIVEAYAGDLVGHIERNAILGEGVAHVCDEVDAWETLARATEGAPRPVLLTGEQDLEASPARRHKRNRPPQPPGHHWSFDVLSHVAPAFPAPVYRRLQGGFDSEIAESRADHARHPAGYLYVTERLPRILMPWRAYFPGRFMTLRYPLLDYRIMDLMATVPVADRKAFLFHRAVEKAFPRAFAAPRAVSDGYYFPLAKEIVRQAAELRHLLTTTGSRLDDLVPQSVALELIERVCARARLGPRVARGLRRRGKRLRARVAGVPSSPVPASPRRLSDAAVLRNLLILRQALRS